MGLQDINEAHRATIISLGQYITNSTDQKTKLIKNHQQQTSQQTSITKLAELFSPSCLITEPEIPPQKLQGKVEKNIPKVSNTITKNNGNNTQEQEDLSKN